MFTTHSAFHGRPVCTQHLNLQTKNVVCNLRRTLANLLTFFTLRHNSRHPHPHFENPSPRKVTNEDEQPDTVVITNCISRDSSFRSVFAAIGLRWRSRSHYSVARSANRLGTQWRDDADGRHRDQRHGTCIWTLDIRASKELASSQINAGSVRPDL